MKNNNRNICCWSNIIWHCNFIYYPPPPPQLDKNSQNSLKTYKPNNKNNNLKFLNKNEEDNKETHIKGNQSAFSLNVIWASHKEGDKEKDAFYLDGDSGEINSFKFDSEEKIDGYQKIDLSNVLQQKNQNEVIQNFSLGDGNYYRAHDAASISFWTKTTNDNKYHIYTAGYSRGQLGRQDTANDSYKTFKRIQNPENNSEDFDEIKELSLTADTLTIWTKDSKNDDHIYFGGENYGQFGDESTNNAYYKLVEKTQDIKPSINNQKIKDIAFDYNNSGFILTENNKLFAAGKNTHGELGLPTADSITTFTEVNTSKLGEDNIKQMSTNIHGNIDDSQSLLLVTENNKLWGLGYDGLGYQNNGHCLGIDPEKGTEYLTKLTKIETNIENNEKILYAQTSTGQRSAYSFLITEDNTYKHKVYMAGSGTYFKSTDPNKWTYNQDITNKIFSENGLDINFKIENLGNAKYNYPIILSTFNITAMGQIKTDKEKQFQQKSLVLGNNYYYDSWKTSPIIEPTIDNSSVKIDDSIDESGKGQIIYTFDIESHGKTIIYDEESKKIEPDSKVGQEKYEFKEGNSKGKNVQVIISNIDLLGKKETTYNGSGHKFKLTIGYQGVGSKTKYTKPIENEFKPFIIHQNIDKDKIKDKIKINLIGKIQMYKNSFTYEFETNLDIGDSILHGHHLCFDGQDGTPLTPKVKENSKLKNAKLILKSWPQKNKNLYTLTVSNLPIKKAIYNNDDSIFLELHYKDGNHKVIGKETLEIYGFSQVNFEPVIIIPPALSTLQIILIGVGILLFAVLFSGTTIGLLRKKDSKAFAKYEEKQMALDSRSYALATVVKERTKKERRKAIKDWKKRMKQDKKFNR